MTAAAQTPPQDSPLFVTANPSDWACLLRSPRLKTLCFPFNDPRIRYAYFARNTIYAVAQLWQLDGCEVLFPAYHHGVELEALLAAGVRPSFYPVGANMRVRADDISARIGRRTRAIYLIHYLGFPGPVEEVAEICRERGLILMEDCALALFSRLGAKPLGAFGDVSFFCLYKTLPVPNGGAVLLGRGNPAELPRLTPPSIAATLAHAAAALSRNWNVQGHHRRYRLLASIRAAGKAVTAAAGIERVATGTDHFNPVNAHIGMSRFTRVLLERASPAAIIERRRRNYEHLLDQLRRLSPPIFEQLPAGMCPLFYPLRVRNKVNILAALRTRGVETINFWSTRHPACRWQEYPEVDDLRQSIVELPCHQEISDKEIDRLAGHVREVLIHETQD